MYNSLQQITDNHPELRSHSLRLQFLKSNADFVSPYLVEGFRYSYRIRIVGNRPLHIGMALASLIGNWTLNARASVMVQFFPNDIELMNFAKDFIQLFFNTVHIDVQTNVNLNQMRINLEYLRQFIDNPFGNRQHQPDARKVVYNETILECPDECCVCYESVNKYHRISCGHYVHKSCIVQSAKTTCPMCRQEVELTVAELNEIENIQNKHIPVYPHSLQQLIRQAPATENFIRQLGVINTNLNQMLVEYSNTGNI